jgi:glutathione synthase/RimK-type ligase-like ATP-grasp enzyme
MKKIALATSQELSDLTTDDKLFVNILKDRGIDAVPAVWDSDANWESFDLIIIRSCWDYVQKLDKFLLWLNTLEQKKLFVQNTIKTIKGNIDKNYLNILKEKGVNIIPTVFVEKSQEVNLSEIMQFHHWEKVVIKPCISATGYNTFLIDKNEMSLGQSNIKQIQQESGLLIQQFINEINFVGEWSFIFFNGKYSHSVIKKTAEKDFRVQEKFGGKTEKVIPPDFLIEQAKEIIGKTTDNCLYTRVDGVESKGKLLLMELELVEPCLYLEHDENAAERFASEIISIL